MPAIEITNLTKRFGTVTALQSVSMTIPEGVVFGFLGPNGAGKTTLMRILLGLIKPTSGSVELHGKNLNSKRRSALKGVGALIEGPTLYPHLSGRDNLGVTTTYLGLQLSEIERVLKLVGLEYAANRKVKAYSMGMRQRLGLARALLGHPRLLILDEPTNGLDPESAEIVRQLIQSLPRKQNCTVFLSSHVLSDVEKTVDHAAILRDGKIVLCQPMAELVISTERVRIVTDTAETAAHKLTSMGAQIVGVEGETITLQAPEISIRQNTLVNWNRELQKAGYSVSQIYLQTSSLESLYHQTAEKYQGAGT